MLRALVSKIDSINANIKLAKAEAAKISDANALTQPTQICTGDYNNSASPSIAVIMAGAAK